jgi:alpha-1,2-mannosyltransferase
MRGPPAPLVLGAVSDLPRGGATIGSIGGTCGAQPVNGNPSSPNDSSSTFLVPGGSAASGGSSAPGGSSGPRESSGRGGSSRRFGALRPDALRAYWLSPQGIVILAASGLALALRLYVLSRPGYLTGVTEYDDGVYLGGAIRLISGMLPYRGFAFVQPPGILLLMTPVAVIAKVSTATHAMAAARLLTVLASTACVSLVGHLVRYRGVFVTLVSCGVLAVYPDDITTAHTLILEPWMNLLLLIGVCIAFRRGRLASPQRLLWAGVAIGFAGAIKYWAALPAVALLVVCLVTSRGGAWRFAVGVVAGFAVPVLPFAVTGPGLFVRSTLFDQAVRAGSSVPESLRLAHLTGLIDILNGRGQLTLHSGTHSLFVSGGTAAVQTTSAGWAPFILTALVVAVIGLGYALRPGRPSPLEWYVLASCAGAAAAVLAYSAFFYHYADFVAPWLAMSVGCAAGTLCGALAGRPGARRSLIAVVGVLVLGLAVFQARELSGLRAPDIYADKAVIPAGSCVVSDEVSLTIAANRFSTQPGCPAVLDSLAITLVEDNGVSVQGGAKSSVRAVTLWRWIFAHSEYVWLSSQSGRRIPWTKGLTQWFDHHFTLVKVHNGTGRVYRRGS